MTLFRDQGIEGLVVRRPEPAFPKFIEMPPRLAMGSTILLLAMVVCCKVITGVA